MKKLALSILACASLVSISHSVCAETRAGALSVTLGAGYDYFSSKRHIDNTSMPFAALDYDITNHWGLEGLLGRFNTDFKNSQGDFRQVNGTIVAFDGVYHFNPYRIVQPYVLAGVGVFGVNPSGTDANNQGNINAGLGAAIFVHRDIAFKFEARDFYTITGGKNDVVLDAGVTGYFDLC